LPCTTRTLRIHGYLQDPSVHGPLAVYGSDAASIRTLAQSSDEMSHRLHPDLPYLAAEIVWAGRNEMARTVEDALARHTRALFLNANAAIQMAETVAKLLAAELGHDATWIDAQVQSFRELAKSYRQV